MIVGLQFHPSAALFPIPIEYKGREIAVGLETRYRLDGLWIRSRCVRDIPHLSRPAIRPIHPPIQWIPCLSGEKAAGVRR